MKKNINDAEYSKIKERMLKDINHRARLLSFVFAFAFVLYGISSFEFIAKFNSDLTLWDNILPRVFLNGIPFLIMSLFLQKSRLSNSLKAWVWSLSFPIIFLLACIIQVWPLIVKGHYDLYYYVHGTNLGIVALMFIIIAPPTKFIIALGSALLFFFLLPLITLFALQEQYFMVRYIINDFLIVISTSVFISYKNHKLYSRIIQQDLDKRKNVKKFVGSFVSEAIFEDRLETLTEKKFSSSVLSIDVRGFTRLMKQSNFETTREFVKKYHQRIAQIIESYGGYIQKTAGDGHLITFGINTENEDLSFIPGINNEILKAETRRKSYLTNNTYQAAIQIFIAFESLKNEFNLSEEIQISAAIDYGDISLVMIGDLKSRIEYDIIGLPINRCSRLENYSKEIGSEYHFSRSILIVSEEVYNSLDQKYNFQVRYTKLKPIRDFNEIEYIYFQEFKLTTKLRNIA